MEEAHAQLNQVRDIMTARYAKSVMQIEEIRIHALERCREMHVQFEESCVKLEKLIEKRLLPEGRET